MRTSYFRNASGPPTFETRAFNITTPPALLFSLEGFTTSDEATIRLAVQTAWSQQNVLNNLTSLIGNKDPAFTNEENFPTLHNALRDFINTVRIERVDIRAPKGIPTPRFNVFSDFLPSTDPYAWTDVHLALKALPYPSEYDGTGVYTRLAPCSLCRSYTHPTGLCPFPNIPGWNGPKWRSRTQPANRGRTRPRAP